MDSPPTSETPANERPLERLLHTLGRQNEGVRICIGNANTFRVLPTLFRPDTVDIAVSGFTRQGYNVWYEINYAPHISGARTSEADVTRLTALYADIDYKPAPGGMGDEYMAWQLINTLSGALGIEPSAVVKSGHGLQPYWPLADGHIDDINQQTMINLSKRWGLLVQELARAEGGGVDNVFDLARIFRAPGSINWKDTDKPIPVTVDYNDRGEPLTVDEVSEVLDAYGIRHPDTAELAGEIVSPVEDWHFAAADCAHIDIIMSGIDTVPGGRHQWLLQQATLLVAALRYGCVTQASYKHFREQIEARLKVLLADPDNPRKYNSWEVESAFKRATLNVQAMSDVKVSEEMRRHPHGFLKIIQQADAAIARGETNVRIVNQETPQTVRPTLTALPRLTDPAPGGAGPNAVNVGVLGLAFDTRRSEPVTTNLLNAFAYTDAANAERLAGYLENQYIYVADIGWHRWEEGRYLRDTENTIMERAKESLLHYRRQWPAVDLVQKHVEKSLSASGIRNSVALAQSLPGIITAPHQLDVDPYALPTPGGIVNLRDGTIRDAVMGQDLVTMRTTVTPDRDVPITRWLEFLEWCMGGADGMVEYMQQLLGATLIGEPRFHILPICTGTGRNGKSTMLQVVEALMGSFAKRMPEGFLIETRGTQHPTEIAALRGIRLAIAQEAKANGRFAEARVKELTGEKVLTGRFMGKDFFDFRNAVTLWLAVNHLPTVSAGGDSFWRRIRKIDFPNKIDVKDVVENLDESLVNEEGPGILQWMIDGAVKVIAQGMREPDGVKTATREYAVQEDHLGQWVADNLVIAPDIGAVKDDVYSRYVDYCSKGHITSLAKSVFMRELPHYIEINPLQSTTTILGGVALTRQQPQFGPLAPPPNVPLTRGPLPPSFGTPESRGLFGADLAVGDDDD